MTEVFLYNIPSVNQVDLEKLMTLVSPERKAKIDRLSKRDKRLQSLFSAVLLRAVLCNRLKIKNTELQFSVTTSGKPTFENRQNLHFSISHTDGLVAVALSDTEVGIDVEREKLIDLKICERFFTKSEQRYVLADSTLGLQRFFEIWTKKEAFAKCSGQSLAKTIGKVDVLNNQTLKTFVVGQYTVSLAGDVEDAEIFSSDYCEKLLRTIATDVKLW